MSFDPINLAKDWWGGKLGPGDGHILNDFQKILQEANNTGLRVQSCEQKLVKK